MKKNGFRFARMNSDRKKICTGKDLVEALDRIALTVKEAKAWHKDLIAGRKTLKTQKNKW
jgi:hypothetical protein